MAYRQRCKSGCNYNRPSVRLALGTTACKWDNVIPFDEMWERLKNLRMDRTPIVLFGSEPFSSALRMSNIKEYKYDWVWEKSQGVNFAQCNHMPMSVYETISVFGEFGLSKTQKSNRNIIHKV